MENVKGKKEGIVSGIEKKQFKQLPPNPFDLTALQIEAYRVFRIQPKDTLAIAQDLYTAGYISYPRTSSNQLNPKIGYSKVLSLLFLDSFHFFTRSFNSSFVTSFRSTNSTLCSLKNLFQ